MLKIKFDTEAYKTKAIDGHYPSRLAIYDACDAQDPKDPAYIQWASDHGVDAVTGSIVTTIDNPHIVARRLDTLSSQLDDFIGAKQGGPSTTIPDNLRVAIKDAAAEKPDAPIELLIVSSLQKIPHFDLRAEFPGVKFKTTIAAPNEEAMNKSNGLIASKAPEMKDELLYESDWQDWSYDIVAVKTAVHYHSETELRLFVEQVRDTGAKRVVFSDLIVNDDADGKAHWKAQRYSGGVIPIRMLGRGELKSLMEEAGYALASEGAAALSYEANKESSIPKQLATTENYTFIRAPSP